MPEGQTAAAIRAEAWATPDDPACDIYRFAAEMRALGNTVVEVDAAGHRVKLMDVVGELVPGGLDGAPPDWQAAQRGAVSFGGSQ